MTEDIREVCGTSIAPINNIASAGSLDNIYKIYSEPSVQYGIVQEDALVYQQRIDGRMMERIQMVFPFFSTEVHIIVAENSGIRNVNELVGKRVAEGPLDSGTWVTAQVIKGLTGLAWTSVSMSLEQGVGAVRSGRVDAAMLVAGAPIALLKDATGIRLIDIRHARLDPFKYYQKAVVRGNTYRFQEAPVSTYKVNNAMATFAFKYEHQKAIYDLVSCIAMNLEKMQSDPHRHPKWRDVDPLEIERIAWPVHPAALRAIRDAMKESPDRGGRRGVHPKDGRSGS